MADREGVDYAFPPLPTAAGLAGAGKRFAGRYVGPGSGKFLTPAERDALFAAGLDIFLLVEGEADSARGGRSVGRQHAQLALDHARSLGAPVDRLAFYFAVDYDLATSDWPTAAEYLRGAGDVLGVARVGVYGEHDVMVWAHRDGVAAWFFQTYAWSYGQWFSGNHVEQYLNTQMVAGGEVDLCRARQANFGQWSASTPNGDEKMFIFVPDEHGQMWLCDGSLRRVVTPKEQEDFRFLSDQGVFARWHAADGSDVWNGGVNDSFGVDVATLAGGGEPGPAGPPGPPGAPGAPGMQGDTAVLAPGTKLTVTA